MGEPVRQVVGALRLLRQKGPALLALGDPRTRANGTTAFRGTHRWRPGDRYDGLRLLTHAHGTWVFVAGRSEVTGRLMSFVVTDSAGIRVLVL